MHTASLTGWQFWIDVGGTFTDGVVSLPDGSQRILKVLSSGAVKGIVRDCTGREVRAPSLATESDHQWTGYRFVAFAEHGPPLGPVDVLSSSREGWLTLSASLPLTPGQRFELTGGEEAPLLLIRQAMGLRLADPIPPVTVRLGTTRGTNALLTRRGAKTGLVTTRGFRDILRIANQDRPRLFDLAIRKPEPLFHAVAEIDERLDALGNVLQPPEPQQVRAALQTLRDAGCESLAIVLLHAYARGAHEEMVAAAARQMGFREVSVSHRLSPIIKIVSRGDTTVVDAYLNPVLRDYVARLQARLPGSDLRFMTSSGGLVTAERFTGKESVLSGPAGGVLGCGLVAGQCRSVPLRGVSAGVRGESSDRAHRQAAQTVESPPLRLIGFDMGGTSTDVSRYDGRWEYEYETVKAGVRIVTPMLAIETVAAGGGSLCGFDGVKLFVGPQSAGADPGPACYGRGGPLTVTDCNVFLGRVPADCFPFALDRAAITRKLHALCTEIAASPFGRQYRPEQLAEGFLEIADAAMARAIRKVSVAKGYDPADYTLMPFGGAGGQHACGLARLLGMRRILVHPWAGVLSAFGIGHADVRRFRQQTVLAPYSSATLAELAPRIQELAAAARDEVLAEGISPQQISPPAVVFDVRYQGVEGVLSIPQPADGDVARDYAARHRQLFGYDRPGRPLEIVAVRVEVVGRSAVVPPASVMVPEQGTPTASHPEHRAWFSGEERITPVFLRRDVQPGHVLTGPAILAEPTSTLVIEPGFAAQVLSGGEVLIQPLAAEPTVAEHSRSHETGRSTDPLAAETSPNFAAAAPSEVHSSGGAGDHSSSTAVDPVQLELFHHTFTSIAEQMGVTLQQTSVSTNVKERLDFSCALFDAGGGLVVNAPHIPVHLGAMSETVRCILRDNPTLQPGDVFVTNDPYRGGSHLPDVTVVTPVHDPATGELLFFTASRAHHAEIGGIVPGSMPPFSRNLGEEGVLIRNFRLISGGASRESELEHLLRSGPYPSRAVSDNLADLRAQVAANHMGARLLQALIAERGKDVVLAYMGHLQRAAAAAMRRALAAIPDGEYRFVDHLDDGSPIAATIAIRGESARIDFTGTGPVLPSNLNANRAIVTAAVMYVLRCLIGCHAARAASPSPEGGLASGGVVAGRPGLETQLPLNGGVLEPIDIVLPECLLNPPEHPDPAQCPAMVGGNVETSQRIVDVLLGALGLAAASQGTMNNFSFGNGTFGYYETICGGAGATADADGADAVHTHMTNTRLTDPEVLERRYPVRLHEFAIRGGSGGQGRHRGGDGVIRKVEFLQSVQVSLLTERRGPFAPYGLHGGQPGRLGRNLLVRRGATAPCDVGGKAAFSVQPGDVLIIETPGGGGYGQPGDAQPSPDDAAHAQPAASCEHTARD